MAAQRALMGSDKGGNLGFTHGEMVRNAPYYAGMTTGGNESYPFAAQGFGGLLDSEIVLDSSLVGDVVITLHTAPASIISVSNNVDTEANYTAHAGNGVGNYTLGNLFASIEVMAVSDPLNTRRPHTAPGEVRNKFKSQSMVGCRRVPCRKARLR
eukprot:scaffold12304_cov121-Isochrysis_galbana.AAC.11